jgi:two-component system, cell cycle sensor histidine kinase and response regulator CckA
MYQQDIMQRSRATRPEIVAVRQFRKKSTAFRILRRAVGLCQELVFITDADGVLEYVNPSCETVTGYSASELIDKNLNWIAPAVLQGGSWDSIREQALQKGAFRGVTGLRRKNGSVVELDLAVTVVHDPRTQVASLAWAGTVVAQHHDTKDETDGPHKMESLGVFAGGIAHDFNNLLMVISAYAEMGLSAIPAEHVASHHMQEILATVRRASHLTRRLLMFGHHQVGQQLVSLNWIVEDAIGMLSRLVEEDIEIRVSLGKDVALVRVDPGQMEQVLLNLVVNARDAMPNGGDLVVETQTLVLDNNSAATHAGVTAGEHVLLTVTDSGHGMNTEQLARIFEPFYTTKPEGKGTGLGLAIVQSIVKENRGAISAASEPGVGTSFNVYLPVAAQQMEKKTFSSFRQELAAPRGNEALLVIEDAEPVRQSTVEFLCSLGYKVRSADNGQEALRNLQNDSAQVALVIADVVMPRMGGPEFARKVAALRSPTKVLFMSGHAEDVVLSKGVNSEDRNFLQKPFSLKSLALKIREVLDEPVRARAAVAPAASSQTAPV